MRCCLKWDVNEYIKYGKENAVNGKWMKELENASAKFHISKYEALKIQTQQSLEAMFAKQGKTVTDTMQDVFKSGYFHTAYELQNGFGIGWDIVGINQSELEKILSKPWAADGKNFSERIWGNKEKLINEVHTQLTQNIITGADPQKAINAIAKKMNTSKTNAGRLVMTEEAYFSSLAQKECFNDLDVEKYEIVATLDSHTSDICQSLDGKVFDMKDYESGTTAPPFHVNCRSTTVPYFDENFGQIGERAARDSETGKTYYIPDDMNYKEWKETFTDGGSKNGLQRVDISGNGDIIEEGISGKRVHNTGSNKVDLEYIQSKKYHQKFKSLPYDDKINEQIYNLSKAMLTHRNGTDKEDMYLIGLYNGMIMGKQTASKSVFGVDYNKSLNDVCKNAEKYTLISLHNHPTENPPTGSDFASMGYRRYHSGVVVCHNGKVYWYKTGDKPFMAETFDKLVNKYKDSPYNMSSINAHIQALNDFKLNYGIEWRELQ